MGDDADRLKAEIREFVRTHHPDRGGDPAAFATGLSELRHRLTLAETTPSVTVHGQLRKRGAFGWLRSRRAQRRRPPRVS